MAAFRARFFRLVVGRDDVHFIAMSGWGCRHQLDDQCLRLRKTCKPGIPGCVLYGKVRFISDVEEELQQKKTATKQPKKKAIKLSTNRRALRGSPTSSRTPTPPRGRSISAKSR